MTIQDEKREYRSELIRRRWALTAAERAEQSLRIGHNIAAFLDSKMPDRKLNCGVYSAMEEELDLAPTIALLYASSDVVAYPCVHRDDDMEFFALSAHDIDANPPIFLTNPKKLVTHEQCAGLQVVDPKDLDVLLVPGVGFDRERFRLGYGWGCYDRFLAKVSPDCLVVGVCFDAQLVESLPHEPHDKPMDFVITPTIAY